ncbi:unnamed protein product [Microthlaspi erraticum]|uniref:RING-type E3 ubiquitin transferase n=1 Tax=Microthlaspi erraticum TaxID=1685480 RepID=A0A6D2LC39_9BRAS|nr:unnamed protein product [Microthlaspi erraticum]
MSLPDSLQASSSSPPVAREESGYIRFEHGQDSGFDHRDRPPWNRSEYDYRNGGIVASENARNTSNSEDPWSCVVVVATFCVFVSMTLILGLYGTTNVWLGPNSSFLIKPNTLFVQNVIVEELGNKGSGMMLYGLNQAPELDVLSNWSEVHYLAVPNDSYKYWIQYLNKGSRVKVSYNVESVGSSLYLVIAQGVDGLSEWVQDPTRPDTTLTWRLISDSGFIEQDITKSSTYYVAVGNVYLNDVKATIDIQVEAVLYDTTNANYNCTFPNDKCTLRVPLFGTTAAVLTSPGPKLNNSKTEFCAKLSYEPRWFAYIVCMGVVTVILLIVSGLYNTRQRVSEDENVDESDDVAPLIPGKDDDNSSWCSSYSSILTSTEELEGGHGEGHSSTRYLCAICFDAPRDCFFLSCGHCVACFQCGTRIAETSGFCPVCRRKIRKPFVPYSRRADLLRGACVLVFFIRLLRLTLDLERLERLKQSTPGTMMSFEMNDRKKIGLGLTGFGVFFSFLGIVFVFDKGLLAMGNILFISGVSLTIGLKSTMQFFMKRQNYRGTISFGVGFFFVIIGWPILGMMLETYGFFVLFSGFWPTLAVFAQKIPILGWIIQQPYIRSFFDKYRGKRVPV